MGFAGWANKWARSGWREMQPAGLISATPSPPAHRSLGYFMMPSWNFELYSRSREASNLCNKVLLDIASNLRGTSFICEWKQSGDFTLADRLWVKPVTESVLSGQIIVTMLLSDTYIRQSRDRKLGDPGMTKEGLLNFIVLPNSQISLWCFSLSLSRKKNNFLVIHDPNISSQKW